MSYIFMDESGDLGFDLSKSGTSKHFVITFLYTKTPRALDKIVKKTFSALRASGKQTSGTLHANKERPATVRRLLRLVAEKEIQVVTVIVPKQSVFIDFEASKSVSYSMIVNYLLDRIINKRHIPLDKHIHFVASQRETNKHLNQQFRHVIEKQERVIPLQLSVDILPPHKAKGLQVADFVSWAVFRAHEYGDTTFRDIIADNITEEYILFD